MTEKLPLLADQRQGQFMTLDAWSEHALPGMKGHWISPDRVREYIAEAKREMLTAIEDPQWVILDGMNALELAAYEHGGQAALAAVSKIIGSTASGDPARPELWPGVRARLIALTAKSKPLGALTAPEALRLAADRTRDDLGPSGSNYPDVRTLLAHVEQHLAIGAKPLVALTDEQIRDCLDAIDPATRRLPPGMLAFARAVIAEFCRLNGLAEPKP